MKKYKYRGLHILPSMAIMLVMLAVNVFTAKSMLSVSGSAIAFFFAMAEFIRQRKMSLRDWKKRMAKNDERSQMIQRKAASAAFHAVGICLLLLSVFFISRNPTSEAFFAMQFVLLVQFFTYAVAQEIYNKKL